MERGGKIRDKGGRDGFLDFSFCFLFLFLFFGTSAKGAFVSFPFFHFSPSEGIDDDDDLLMDGWTTYFVNDVSMDAKARRNYL